MFVVPTCCMFVHAVATYVSASLVFTRDSLLLLLIGCVSFGHRPRHLQPHLHDSLAAANARPPRELTPPHRRLIKEGCVCAFREGCVCTFRGGCVCTFRGEVSPSHETTRRRCRGGGGERGMRRGRRRWRGGRGRDVPDQPIGLLWLRAVELCAIEESSALLPEHRFQRFRPGTVDSCGSEQVASGKGPSF